LSTGNAQRGSSDTDNRQPWLKIAAMIAKHEPISGVLCPSCDARRIDFRYVGDSKTRIGYLAIWCDECLRGIRISRVVVPADIEMIPFNAPDRVTTEIPDFRIVEDGD
jgi:hypothetical protein